MDFPMRAIECIIYLGMLVVGLIGNGVLLHAARQSMADRRRTSCMMLFFVAIVHLCRIMVVNILSVFYSVGGVIIFNMVGCKVFKFTSALTMMLAIWFTLYVAIFYLIRLDRVVHPLPLSVPRNQQTNNFTGMLILWATGLIVSCPLLVFTDMSNIQSNATYPFLSQVYTGCNVNYGSSIVYRIYGLAILTSVDAVPLVALLLVSIRIVLLLRERQTAPFGGIWMGEDAIEREIVYASKLILPLTVLLTSLWVSHFTLLEVVDELASYSFLPALLAALSSAYSAFSPYIFLAINYKVRECLKSLCFPPQSQSWIDVSAISPYHF
ncbi:probable G-protein coupled receptor 176 [Polypterus senegalus]|uniref:probable G-protein coupled receptor 176 n=1 Tax=Polypterus senegalus TaxID=55291 RepID=UPI0019650FA8|nr:probable G-protein coupled receptor 176 [Polypterus senegalus]